jgi:hypothetical protein
MKELVWSWPLAKASLLLVGTGEDYHFFFKNFKFDEILKNTVLTSCLGVTGGDEGNLFFDFP